MPVEDLFISLHSLSLASFRAASRLSRPEPPADLIAQAFHLKAANYLLLGYFPLTHTDAALKISGKIICIVFTSQHLKVDAQLHGVVKRSGEEEE